MYIERAKRSPSITILRITQRHSSILASTREDQLSAVRIGTAEEFRVTRNGKKKEKKKKTEKEKKNTNET